MRVIAAIGFLCLLSAGCLRKETPPVEKAAPHVSPRTAQPSAPRSKDAPRRGLFRSGATVPKVVIVDTGVTATIVLPRGARRTADSATETGLVYYHDPGGALLHKPMPDLNTAAKLLAETVEKMTGTKPPVIEEGAPVNGPVIHLGRTELAQKTLGRDLAGLDRDGYVLLSTTEGLLIVGGSDHGAIFGVAALLQRQAGVRWLFPGPLGEVIPKRARLTLEAVNRIDEPAYRGREFWGMENFNLFPPAELAQWQDWLLRNRMRQGRYYTAHNLNLILDAEKFGKEHPEWYPLVGGQRKLPSPHAWSWQPCVAANGVAEETARQVSAYFDAHPEAESFSIANGDGGGWCECAECLKLDGAHATRIYGKYSGRYSRRMIVFFNRVAERVAVKHPDKLLVCYGYGDYIVPPDDLKLHPMLMPYLTCARDGYYDPEFKRLDQANLEKWAARSRQFGLYEYFYGSGRLTPNIYTGLLADALRHAYARGARGFTSEAYPNWGLDAPKLWAAAHLLWDPDQDPQALLADFCANLFGPAADPMQECFAIAERAVSNPNNPSRRGWFDFTAGSPAQFIPFTPEVIARLNRTIAGARAAASDDLVRRRVEFFAKCFETLDLMTPSYRAQQLMHAGASMREVLEAMQPAQPVKDRLLAYWKEKEFSLLELYPGFRYEVARGDGWGGGLVQALEQGMHAPTITSQYGQQIAREVMDRVLQKPPDPAADVPALFRQEVATALEERLGKTTPDTPLDAMRKQVADWALKIAPARRVAVSVKVDGKLDDAVWSEAIRCRNFVAYATGKPQDFRTEFAFAHDATNLYLAAWCYQGRAEAEATGASEGRDGDAWAENSIELFLDRNQDGAPYHQIAINRKGGVFDARADNPTWNLGGLQCAAELQDRLWTIEAAFPWKALEINPQRDRILRLNVTRNRILVLPDGNKNQEITTWFLSSGAHKDPRNRGFLLLN